MPPDTPELLPARVWLARRAVDKNNQRLPDATFKQVLAETFIPATVQWMHHFGLTTYIPSLWPLPAVDSPNTRPDETALVLYKSVEEYEKAAKTPTGRLYFKAHSLAFDTGLNKNFPSRYSPKTGSNFGAPYFGGTGALDDWSQHPVHVVALHHATPATATEAPSSAVSTWFDITLCREVLSARNMAVSTPAGHRQETPIPWSPYSIDSHSAKATAACLVTA